MGRTPTLFLRDERTHRLTSTFAPDCAWVGDGEGAATEKIDGLTIRLTVQNGHLVRVERKHGGSPAGRGSGESPRYTAILTPASGRPWADPQDAYLLEAAANTRCDWWVDGSYDCEAIGPQIQGNRYDEPRHLSRRLDPQMLPIYGDAPRTFAGLQIYLRGLASLHRPRATAEGIVFWHPDGRRAKIKVRDLVA